MTQERGAGSDTTPGDFDLDSDCYRRRIVARRLGAGAVVCDLVDDFHHFRVAITHDGEVVTDLTCESVRWPWSTCPEAAQNLTGLVGAPLPERFTDAATHAEPRHNCTHQFDCAAHALMHAARDAHQRRFDIEVPAQDDEGIAAARMWVDGRLNAAWSVSWSRILATSPALDNPPPRGFMAWADANFDPDAAEALIVMRRATTIGLGRGWPFDDFDNAGQVDIGESGVCYTMTPGRSAQAVRVRGTVRDFAADPDAMLDIPKAELDAMDRTRQERQDSGGSVGRAHLRQSGDRRRWSVTKTEDTLAGVSFFAGLTDRELREVARLMTPVDIEAGRVLTKQGSPGREFFVIIDGTARVTRDGEEIGSLGTGDHFGEVSLLDALPRAATVTATTPMTVEVLTRSEFVDLLDRTPLVMRKLLRSLAEILAERAGY